MFNYKNELMIAINAARAAGQEVLRVYKKHNFKIKYKLIDDPITLADLAANKIILAGLKPCNYGLLSEESADDLSRLKSKRAWIVDPLDGTSDFINKTGEFTIMIGLVEAGRPIFGVIYNPTQNILYYGAKGAGSFIKKAGAITKLKVSNENNIREARAYVSRFHLSETEKEAIAQLGIRDLVTCGSSKKICLIASGEGEMTINLSDRTWEWDICAADIILSEAGGKLTDRNGQDFLYNKKIPRNLNGYVASNGLMHRDIIEKLKKI